MERMNEIMKERVEADEIYSTARKARQAIHKSQDSEMAIVGPIKVGDIVDVTGLSYRGKKMIVDRFWISTCRWHVGVKARGRVLRKDGTPGLKHADHFIEVAVAP